MELKDNDSGYKNKNSDQKRKDIAKRSVEGIRRPFGVAALEVTDVLRGKVESDDEMQIFVPFMQCFDKDTLDSTIRKIVSAKGGEISEKEHKGQGLWLSHKLLLGDLEQARGDCPHLVSPFTQVARRMGFPEIILPGDVRNDLYVTLISGDFGSKAFNAKNIEVTVKVADHTGTINQESITVGPGLPLSSEYKSVVYYHEEKPRWLETIKISLSIEEFRRSHLKIFYKHRSSNDTKDKNEKPFAFSFVKLMNENGTTLEDCLHELLIYKIDWKKFDDGDCNVGYLHNLPSTSKELETKGTKSPSNSFSPSKSSKSSSSYSNNVAGLSLIPSDVCVISSIVCSTKLTQNIDLLGLLKYPTENGNDSELKSCLYAFMKVDGEEIVKFLQDILDSLFNILQSRNSSDIINLVFESFVFVFGLISNTKYQHFRPILDVYVQKTFSYSSSYKKLIMVLKRYLDNIASGTLQSRYLSLTRLNDSRSSLRDVYDKDWMPNFMKSLEYFFKFIVRSRSLYMKLKEVPIDDIIDFQESVHSLLESLTGLISHRSKASVEIQQMCLEYLPLAIPDIVQVFEKERLSHIITSLIVNVPNESVKREKLKFMLDIIQCESLFFDGTARSIILPFFTNHIRILLEKKVEVALCVQVLSEILISLHQQSIDEIDEDITDIMKSILWTVILAVISRKGDDVPTRNLVAIMIDILRLMRPSHYQEYMNMFESWRDLFEFLVKILMLFKDLVSSPIFSKDWNEMIMLQNSVILASLKQFAKRIRETFLGDQFEHQLWNNFFYCAISFLSQEALQLENFSPNKKSKIKKRYGDMRRELASEIRTMWFHLDTHTIKFVPHMIGPFLEMALIPDYRLRKEIIPIFFEMMQCEYYSNEDKTGTGNFKKCEEEMIIQLDRFFEARKGDEEFHQLFKKEMVDKFENHPNMGEIGMKFVVVVSQLMRRLLEYRMMLTGPYHENIECQMITLVNLLEFYTEHERRELYIRYLYKLFDLHIACENYTEAAYALWFHSRLLDWSDEPPPSQFLIEKYSDCKTQLELKEKLYQSMIEYFEKGQQWEEGLIVCRELIIIYERDILNYETLCKLYQKMSTLYGDIVKQTRCKREYYRVGYYGQGFPAFLRNKVFIHRSKDYERLSDFSKRLTGLFPEAIKLEPTAPITRDMQASDDQYLQINSVDPIVELPEKFKDKFLHPHIFLFYESNRVKDFCCSRVFKRNSLHGESEISCLWLERVTMRTKYPLPGIAPCFLVVESSTKELPPIQIAIEDLEKKQDEFIKELSNYYFNVSNQNVSTLLQKIQGVVEAAVNGGIDQYEKAFMCPEFMNRRDNLTVSQKDEYMRHLKNSILSLIPLINIAFAIVEAKVPPSLKPLYDHLTNLFKKMKFSMEQKYKSDFNSISSAKLNRVIQEFDKKGLLNPSKQKFDRSTFTQSTGKGRSRSVFSYHASWSSSSPSLNQSLRYNYKRLNPINKKSKEGGNTKWFDSVNENPPSNGIIVDDEEELITQRPIRSFRPKSSGTFRSSQHSMGSHISSASLGHLTIESDSNNHSDKDNDSQASLPPSLPPKHVTSELNRATLDHDNPYFTYIRPRKNSLPSRASTKSRPLPPYPAYNGVRDSKVPPEPPARPSRSTHNLYSSQQ